MKTVFTTLAFVCLASMGAIASDYEAYKELNPHSASELSTMKALAEKGDAADILAYGKALEYQRSHSKGIQESDVQSWFQKAADKGSAEAWYWIAYTTTNEAIRRKAIIKAAELGFSPAFEEALDILLFRAGEKADVVKAKQIADLARQKGISVYNPDETFVAVDACYAAGTPQIASDQRDAIEADENSTESFTPNDNMKWAEGFANGWGVKRDRQKALAFVCHGSTVPAELNGMVAYLLGRKGIVAFQEPFRFCDHVTSSENGGLCSSAAEDRQQSGRNTQFDAHTAKWSAQQKSAFAYLQNVAEKYFSEHAGSEQDMSGSARNTFFIEEEAKLRDELLASLNRFEKGNRPPKGDLTAADKALNATYKTLLKNTDWQMTGTVKPEGIRSTQRLWLKYRDAWAAFGPVRYPGTKAQDWKAWATRERITTLKSIAGFKD